MPATSSVLSLAPDSSVAVDTGNRNGRHLSICGLDPGNCFKAAGYEMSKAASDALNSAIEGKIPAAYLQLASGVQDLVENATEGVSVAADILASPNVYVAPDERGTRRIANASATPANVEMKVTAAGTSVYVMSGSCVVLNSASGGFVKLTAGH